MKTKRHVLLHYHFFKNAGTSIDRMLEGSFGKRWGQLEASRGLLTPEHIARHLAAHPDLLALSSHTASFPLPQIEGVEIFPIVMLRNPIDRVLSTYTFERQQGTDNLGSKLARQLSFAKYVEHFLSLAGDRRFRSFQQQRLARGVPGTAMPEFDRALQFLDSLPWVGVVEDFDFSIRWLARLTGESYKLKPVSVRANATSSGRLADRLAQVRRDLGAALYQELSTHNLGDWALWERAWRKLRS